MNKIFSTALLTAALSACGGGGSGSSDTNTAVSPLDDVTPVETAQAELNIENVQDFIGMTMADHDLRQEARQALFNSQAYARNTLTDTTQCSGGGELHMQVTEGSGELSLLTRFDDCIESSVTFNGATQVKATLDTNGQISKLESSYQNYLIEGQDAFTGELFALLMQGGYTFTRQGENRFTEIANTSAANLMTGQKVALEGVHLTFELDISQVLPQQAQGTIVSSEHGSATLSQATNAIVITGNNSRLEVTETKDSFGYTNGVHFSLDTDNDGNIDNMGEAYNFDSDINWIY
ncbi:hypothetical protein [Motilimonas pumila]|uniref:Lipoprotein n=1 Tax=Motilimonas pumila TaxID=2303987 RepID=A0A418YIY9_9GAMM|nr:hypothetical protein [Motilimonas pumila]RJG50608.1 hypothetical protein D1Z90_03815 [Motilimonas pumila]